MATRSAEREGLDLRKGVAASKIKEGSPLAGHVDGEPVLLVRHEGEVYAIGASCTHHGAPLADGLVVGGEIRCPWHHACFSLRTGDVTAPPALNPLPRWRVEQRDGRVFVGKKYDPRDPLTMRDAVQSNLRCVVIIGAGAAGTAAAETLRSKGFKGIITVIDPDPDAPYDRPNLSKDYLAGTAPEEWLPLRPDGFYAQHGIRRIYEKACAVDAVNRRITIESGQAIIYDALLLATGATPVRPRIPGSELPHVYVLRTMFDCKALINAVTPGKKVLVAGASFIGMEAAAALRQRGAEVTVVAPEMIPFAKVLGPTIGSSLMRLHESRGVSFNLGRMLHAIGPRRVLLDDGTSVNADVVLLGIGVKPKLDLAASAGIDVDNGVVVNEFLETNVLRIYAAGDIARYLDARTRKQVRIEHWTVAQRQGQIAARNILGERIAFDCVPFFWTQQYDTSVSYVGHAEDYTHIQVDGSPDAGDCGASFMSDDQLLAYVSIGRDQESLKIERKLETWGT